MFPDLLIGEGIVSSPTLLEFWQGRSSRLHDRIVYTKDDNKWTKNSIVSVIDQYFKRFNSRTIKVAHHPFDDLRIIVVIPIYNEEDLNPTLESLFLNQENYSFSVEVIALVNDSSLEKEVKESNQKTFIQLKDFAKNNNNEKAFLIPIYKNDLDPKHAGCRMGKKIRYGFSSRKV